MERSVLIGIIMFLGSFIAAAQSADDIIGTYHLPNDLDVEIYKHNNKYYGKIIALNNFENGQLKDIHNPDKTKQDEPLLGKIIIQDLVYNSLDKNWINGKMYSSEKGIVFNFKVVAINRNEIEIEGSKYFFSKTMQWNIL